MSRFVSVLLVWFGGLAGQQELVGFDAEGSSRVERAAREQDGTQCAVLGFGAQLDRGAADFGANQLALRAHVLMRKVPLAFRDQPSDDSSIGRPKVMKSSVLPVAPLYAPTALSRCAATAANSQAWSSEHRTSR